MDRIRLKKGPRSMEAKDDLNDGNKEHIRISSWIGRRENMWMIFGTRLLIHLDFMRLSFAFVIGLSIVNFEGSKRLLYLRLRIKLLFYLISAFLFSVHLFIEMITCQLISSRSRFLFVLTLFFC